MQKVFLASLLALLCMASTPLAALAGEGPEFRLGFRALADQIPDMAGEPLEDEHHNPLNGDALQRTTTGLMVWRKADNWTAFTDGCRTWIHGPLGLQLRGNDERFDWEVGWEPPLPGIHGSTAPPPLVAGGPGAPSPASSAPGQPPGPTAMPTPPPAAASAPVSAGIRSPDPAGEWVTSVSSSTRYYTSRDSAYWRSWSPKNRIWFATEAGLLAAYPGRIRR